jgi:prefoldin subunit 5
MDKVINTAEVLKQLQELSKQVVALQEQVNILQQQIKTQEKSCCGGCGG